MSTSRERKRHYQKLLESKCPITSIKCKGCQKEFLSTTISKHLGHKKACKDSYSLEELESIKEKANLRKWLNMKIWLNKNDQSQKNAKRYRERKERLKSTDDEELSEYEKIRLANIKGNKVLLEQFKSKNKM